tara:strand:+ start:1012 stop:1203 length:192 start_codon:yes stop_codon:yes gene_type:complete
MFMGSKKAATKLVSTGGGSMSLRTTIPMWIVEHFNLNAGDSVNWKFDVSEGEIIVVMTPAPSH